MRGRRASKAPSRQSPRRARKGRLTLHVQIVSRGLRIPVRQVRRWARAALKSPGEITLRIVGAAEARALNRRYLGRDYSPNVLAFPYGRERGVLHGDVVLCAPVIAREARAQGKAIDAHLAHLTVHGLLHLQGHTHTRLREAARMESLETKLLVNLGYPDPNR